MKFSELSVGDKFTFNGQEYIKIQDVKANCCRTKYNCEVIATGQKELRNVFDQVEKVESN